MEPTRTNPDDSPRINVSRKIVIVDIENVLDGHHEMITSDDLVERAVEILRAAQARRPEDQVIVGCNPTLAFSAVAAFPGAQLVVGKGTDGADLALIQKFDPATAASRFTELCIVSGDHAFAPIARASAIAGLPVRLVVPHGGLSAALSAQSDLTVTLPELHPKAIERSAA